MYEANVRNAILRPRRCRADKVRAVCGLCFDLGNVMVIIHFFQPHSARVTVSRL